MNLHNEELIKKWEGLRLEAYLPTPNDVWTIGWGHTKGVRKGMVIDKETAQVLFEEDTKWAVNAVNRLVTVGLSQNQFDALVSFVFNIGETNFSKSTLLKRLNAGKYREAADQMLRWDKQKGKVLKGLVRRRAEEREYFLQEDIVEDEVSGSPDMEDQMKSLLKSKEMLGGGSLVAIGSAVGALSENAQMLLVVALIAAGAWFMWNRFNARNKGER